MDVTRRKFFKIAGPAVAGWWTGMCGSSFAVFLPQTKRHLSEKMSNPKVKVIGIGGAGCNMIDYAINQDLENIDFIAANLDPAFLEKRSFPSQIVLGEHLGGPPGLGGGPEVAEAYTAASEQTIRSHLQGSDVAIILARLGGVGGSGGAPVVAQISRNMGIRTIGLLAFSYNFGGKRRMNTAQNVLSRFSSIANMSIVIPNSAISSSLPLSTAFRNALKKSDEIAYLALKVLTDIL